MDVVVNKGMLRPLVNQIQLLICTSKSVKYCFPSDVKMLGVTVCHCLWDAKRKTSSDSSLHSGIKILEPFWRCVQAIENQSAHVTFPETF
jgi:hypothetical protein